MSIRYRIVEAEALVVTTFAGRVTDAELLEHDRLIAADPAVPRGHRELVDLRAVTSVDVSPEGLAALVERDARRPEIAETRLAIVAPRDLAFGFGRAYQARSLASRPEVEVFRTAEAAAAWLGVPLEAVER